MENKKVLEDVFLYNGIKYASLTDESHKQIIEKMVAKLEEDNIAWIILTFEDPFMNIINPTNRHTTFEYQTNIPDDLSGKIVSIYAKVAFVLAP